MKRFLILLTVMLLCCALAGCCMSHEWQETTCTAPKTCTKCGEVEGEPLAHTWQEAACEAPKTCSVCQATEGDALGHTWQDATCAESKRCDRCGKTEGTALEHSWQDATKDAPMTCTLCGEEQGTAANYFAVNGLELEELPKSVSATAIMFNTGNEKNQVATPAEYQNITCKVVKEEEDGSKQIRIDFMVIYESRGEGPLGLNGGCIDYNFFDKYTGEVIPISESGKGTPLSVKVGEETFDVINEGSVAFDYEEMDPLEDGTLRSQHELTLGFDLYIPENYDGLVLAVASPKAYGIYDKKWEQGLVSGMFAGEFENEYADYYEDVRFFRIPIDG